MERTERNGWVVVKHSIDRKLPGSERVRERHEERVRWIDRRTYVRIEK